MSDKALAQIGEVGSEEVRAMRKGGPAAMEVAEIESQIATAKRYPRDIKRFKVELLSMATIDEEVAASCYYALPRDGKTIDGPSVRLAEIALSCYGNCLAQADVESEDDRFVYAVGACRDLERNVAVRVRVRRRITDKRGNRFKDDMIAVTANAACSIALRNAIFKVVPAAYIKPAFDQVKAVATGSAKSLSNRRAEVLRRLAKMGVDEARVLHRLGRRSTEDITVDDVTLLIGLGTAVHDGEVELDTAFPAPPDPAKEAAKAAAKLDAKPATPAPSDADDALGMPDEPADPDFERRREAASKQLAEAGGAGKRSNLF